jgi:hypothetical protein
MIKNFILSVGILAGSVLTSSVLYAQTPIEVMVQREMGVHNFVPTGDFWQADNNFDASQLLKNMTRVQALQVDFSKVAAFAEQRVPNIKLSVPKQGGGTYVINLVKYDFFADGFVVEENANGVQTPFNYHPGVYYRGTVEGAPGSLAAFSFFNNELYGTFSLPGEIGNYAIVSLNNTQVNQQLQTYILYNDQDFINKDNAPKCANDLLPEKIKAAKTTTTLSNKVYGTCREIRIYEVCDYSTYVKKGNSSTAVTNYITSVFNNISLLYLNESVLVTLKYLQINTTSDVYAAVSCSGGSIAFLNKFGQTVQNTLYNTPYSSDVAVLYSAMCSSQLGGVAWLQSLCGAYSSSDYSGPYAYCNIDMSINFSTYTFPSYVWDIEVATHEIGHTLGSPHTHRCCWNPPGTGTTAIDGCYTIEGSCATPPIPSSSVGGTIMSYCHLTSAGIKFTNGFGTQPGDTIRFFTGSLLNNTFPPCGSIYNPTTAISLANRTLAANRECTDPTTNITYYFYDNNTASQLDDTMVLMINKNGNNIGNLMSSGFAVSSITSSTYGSGTGQVTTFPAGTPNVLTHSVAMRRYWKITATTQPTSAVEVMFPFLSADTADVDGTVPGNPITLANVYMYKANSPVDPNPANGFTGSIPSNFSIYTYGSAASTSVWSLTTTGSNTLLAHMKMTNLSGGGSGFVTYTNPLNASNTQVLSNIFVYPNPVNNEWMIMVPSDYNDQHVTLQLYSIDGKMVELQSLNAGSTNTISVNALAPGMYFYRIQAGKNLFTGNVVKQ